MPPRKAKGKPRNSSDAVSTILHGAIYLGPCSAASSATFLKSERINHVLSIGITPSPKMDDVIYHRLKLTDSPTSPLEETLDSAIKIISTALESEKGAGRIFIHCSAGTSRSPTIVIGYLMKERGLTLREALGHVVLARPQICPNSGFLHQLKELEVELRGTTSVDLEELPRREADRLVLFAEPIAGTSAESATPRSAQPLASGNVGHLS